MQNISNAALLAEPSIIGRKFENVQAAADRAFALDTSFVLFFLALDLGHSWSSAGFSGLISAFTLLAFLIVPYFLPFSNEKDGFRTWVAGRIVIAAAGATLGLMLRQAVGIVLPESFGYMPVTLLIISAFFSCYVQIYGMIKFRLAR